MNHGLLTREEERELARRIVDGERTLLEALLELPGSLAILATVMDGVRAGTVHPVQVLRNVERARDLAVSQRRRLLRTLRTARSAPAAVPVEGRDYAERRRRLATRLVALRLHPGILQQLETAARLRCGATSTTLVQVEQARRQIDEAKRTLVEHNLRLVASLARRYRNRGLSLLDLIQEGNIGLIHAVDKFDFRRGHRLSTYAAWWIKQSMDRALAVQTPTIRVPIHLVENRKRVRRAQRQLYATRGIEPTLAEISQRARVPTAKVEIIMGLPPEPLSLETPLAGSAELRIGDVIANDAAIFPDDQTANHLMEERARSLLEGLAEREQHIIRLRFGLDGAGGQTLDEIGRSLSLTRERVRQIETSALEKLRARCKAEDYRPDL